MPRAMQIVTYWKLSSMETFTSTILTSGVINIYLDFICIVTSLNCATLLDLLEQSIKLLQCYFYVGNNGFRHTSSMQNILSTLIVESRVLKTYGYSVVFKLMIDYIKTLELNGVLIPPK